MLRTSLCASASGCSLGSFIINRKSKVSTFLSQVSHCGVADYHTLDGGSGNPRLDSSIRQKQEYLEDPRLGLGI